MRHRSFSFFAALSVLVLSLSVRAETYTQIAVGVNHACAVYGAGGVHCWGRNLEGQLGDGSVVSSSVPVAVPGLTGVTALAAGAYHTCAVSRGDVWCWGFGFSGALGSGSVANSSVPLKVPTLTSTLKSAFAIAAGRNFSCALLRATLTGATSARCWGNNDSNQLGDGTSVPESLTPVTVTGLTDVNLIAAGERHVCVALTTGAVKCWGYNAYGQVGNLNDVTPVTVPFTVSGSGNGLGGVTSISAGSGHTCAANGTTGEAWCWGQNLFGQTGSSAIPTNQLTPHPMGSPMRFVKEIAAGSKHTCAVVALGTATAVQCWGGNDTGQLGRTIPSPFYTSVPGEVPFSGGAIAVASGPLASCAIASGSVFCWGNGNYGLMGTGVNANTSFTTAQINPIKCSMDIDGDGQVLATTDALLLARAALGMTGSSLTAGAVGANAPRSDPAQVRQYLLESCGM